MKNDAGRWTPGLNKRCLIFISEKRAKRAAARARKRIPLSRAGGSAHTYTQIEVSGERETAKRFGLEGIDRFRGGGGGGEVRGAQEISRNFRFSN